MKYRQFLSNFLYNSLFKSCKQIKTMHVSTNLGGDVVSIKQSWVLALLKKMDSKSFRRFSAVYRVPFSWSGHTVQIRPHRTQNYFSRVDDGISSRVRGSIKQESTKQPVQEWIRKFSLLEGKHKLLMKSSSSIMALWFVSFDNPCYVSNIPLDLFNPLTWTIYIFR